VQISGAGSLGCQVGLFGETLIALRIGFRRDGSDVDEWVQMVLPPDEARELSRLLESIAVEATETFGDGPNEQLAMDFISGQCPG
jgi:hypothetical protein